MDNVVSDSSQQVLAKRREEYLGKLTSLYTDSYGDWYDKQSDTKRARISKRAGSVKHGLTTIAPLTCNGPNKCPFHHMCPIPDTPGGTAALSEYPVGMPCVLEAEYVGQKVADYITQLDVDPTDAVEMSLIDELALLDLLRNRAVLVMSAGDKRGHGRDMLTIDESVVGWDAEGSPITSSSTKAHPAVDIMDKHEKRRVRILEKLNATRDSKVRLHSATLDSNSRLQRDIEFIKDYFLRASTGTPQSLVQDDEPILLDRPREHVYEETH